MRISTILEALSLIDFRLDAKPDLPFFPEKEDPKFIPKSAGFHFTYHNGKVLLNSTSNAIYDAKVLGDDTKRRELSSMWNQFGGMVEFATKTITIAKDSTGNGYRQRSVADLTYAKKAFIAIMPYGVTREFKIKGWANGTITVGEFLDSEDPVLVVKQNKGDLIMFHGTSMKAYDEIIKTGLRPGMTDGVYSDLIPGYSEYNVYLSTSPKTAEFYGKRQAKKDGSSQYVILQVKVPDLAKLLPDDRAAYKLDPANSVRAHALLKTTTSEDGSAAYRGAILPPFISVVSTRKA